MKMNEPLANAEVIEFRLNGETISAIGGETIIQAAKRHGIDIPHLCYKEGMRADGNCRACMVEIKGERVLAPSCCRAPTAGREGSSANPPAGPPQRLGIQNLARGRPQRVYNAH